jgi:hypothetical protein
MMNTDLVESKSNPVVESMEGEIKAKACTIIEFS